MIIAIAVPLAQYTGQDAVKIDANGKIERNMAAMIKNSFSF